MARVVMLIWLQRFHCTYGIWLEKMTEDLTATGLERPMKGIMINNFLSTSILIHHGLYN
ncbi:hypothetical protein HanRHA438_Chr04g0196261 [Helianthus annuus]|nr:hypothetical protein HanRHA438_Chr04g0196261 [Helianthus annuus]